MTDEKFSKEKNLVNIATQIYPLEGEPRFKEVLDIVKKNESSMENMIDSLSNYVLEMANNKDFSEVSDSPMFIAKNLVEFAHQHDRCVQAKPLVG